MRRVFEAGARLDTRFVAGTPAEVEELFGGQVPDLPEGPLGQTEGETFLVDLFPPIRKNLRELVEHIYRGLTGAGGTDQGSFAAGKGVATFDHFEAALEQVLATIVDQERRLGLMNLFWLAHSKAVAEILHDFFSQPSVKGSIKYQMHPFLQGVHRNVLDRVWARFKHHNGNALRQNLGAQFNTSLIDCIIDDQLPLTETSMPRLNFQQVLVDNNKRFRLTFGEFREMHTLFRDRLRAVVRRKDPRVMDAFHRWCPDLRPDAYDEERGTVRLLFNRQVITHLIAEAGSTAGAFRSPISRIERTTRRTWSDLVLDYLDVAQAVKRSEVVDLARKAIDVVGRAQTEADLRVRYDEGRVFRFYPDDEIVKLARKITVVFADLRGFTATSEGGISERELAHQLYEVFDPFASLVERYHGRIDKFTGDGAMITFGFSRVTPDDELNALRTALAIQERMAALRAEARTEFSMGISVHTGRAQITHFIVNERAMDRTVIGRNVNIAGRLSSSGKLPGGALGTGTWEEAAQPRADTDKARRDVWVDEAGVLFNMGIVVSQDTVEEIANRGIATPWTRGGARGYRVVDDLEKKNILLEYVGDAKFKGVGRSIAIYRLGVEETGTGGDGARSRGRG